MRVLTAPLVIIKGLVCDYFNASVAVCVLPAGLDDGKELSHFILRMRIVWNSNNLFRGERHRNATNCEIIRD